MLDRRAGALARVLQILIKETGAVLNHGGYLVVEEHDPDPMGMGTICFDLSPEEFDAVWVLIGEQPCTYAKCPRCSISGSKLNEPTRAGR